MGGIIRFKKIILPFPVKCGVISDTHSYSLPENVIKDLSIYFADVKYLLHLGDVTHPSVINDIEILGFNLITVQGNNDRMLFNPHVILLNSGPYNIAMVHGSGGGYENVKARAGRIAKSVITEHLDAILFGHTHVPCDEITNKLRYLNPGSILMPRKDPQNKFQTLPSLAQMTIDETGIDFSIFQIGN